MAIIWYDFRECFSLAPLSLYLSEMDFRGTVFILPIHHQAARQLEFFKGRSKLTNTDSLGDALAIAQHHDAVTGTEKQHVANDYAKRLSIGYKEVRIVLTAKLLFLHL